MLTLPYYLGLKAEALHLAGRTSEALEAIKEAEKVVERSEERQWCAELQRLRGVFLTATGAAETQIQTSFREAIRIAKSRSLFHWPPAPKHPTQNTGGRKRARQENADSGCLFANSSETLSRMS